MASGSDYPFELGGPHVCKEDERRSEEMRAHGYQLQFAGFRGVARLLEKRRKAKEEGEREKRRQWLREKIGPVGNGSPGQD